MCGIAGEIAIEGALTTELLQSRIRSIGHRGPDDSGIYKNGRVGLANCRLSVIDLSPHGHQPMTNEDQSVWLAYNGEIYNFRELRESLERRGHVFRSHTDSEVIVHAYEEYGEDCVQRFNGMFAFAIWDKRQQKLFCARDRVGIKPFYYLDQRRMVFASEIKAIVEDRTVPREIDLSGLHNYFSFGHSLGPTTIYKNIRKLMPGHTLVWQDGVAHIRKYWDVPPESTNGLRPARQYEEELVELLRDAVRLQMVSDVPLGVFLSGGLDSSAMVAMASQFSDRPVKTFSVGFEGAAYNELSDARIVAKHFGTDHQELMIGPQEVVPVLDKLAWHFDEPFADTAAIPVYLLSRMARQSVTVVLTGEGGDELFGGYRRYLAEQYSRIFSRLPGFSRSALGDAIGMLPRLRRTKKLLNAMSVADPAQRYASWLLAFDEGMKSQLFHPDVWRELQATDPYAAFREHYYRREKLVDRLLDVDLHVWLPDTYLEKMDKSTMATSLESRVPLLDHRLVEFAFRVPPELKVSRSELKIIMRRAMRGILPQQILEKPKRGFTAPTDVWFRTVLKDFVSSVLSDSTVVGSGFFNRDYIQRLLKLHLEGREVLDWPIYSIVAFATWHRAYMEC